MLPLRLQSNPPETSTELSPYFLRPCNGIHKPLRRANASEVLWLGILNQVQCNFVSLFSCFCICFHILNFFLAKTAFCPDPVLVHVGPWIIRITSRSSRADLAGCLKKYCNKWAMKLLIRLFYLPQKPLVLLHWSVASEGRWTWRRMTTRKLYATMSTAHTALGCTCSASMNGKAAFLCSSIASAEPGAGTKSSVGRTCGRRRDTTWRFAFAPAAVGRAI